MKAPFLAKVSVDASKPFEDSRLSLLCVPIFPNQQRIERVANWQFAAELRFRVRHGPHASAPTLSPNAIAPWSKCNWMDEGDSKGPIPLYSQGDQLDSFAATDRGPRSIGTFHEIRQSCGMLPFA